MHLADKVEIEPIYHFSDLSIARWVEFSLAIQGLPIKNDLSTKAIHIEPDHKKDYASFAEPLKYSVCKLNILMSKFTFMLYCVEGRLNEA